MKRSQKILSCIFSAMLTLGVAVGSTGRAAAPADGILSNRITDRTLGFTARVQLDEALDKLVFEKGPLQVPGLGIIIYKDGREVYSRFIGSRHIDGQSARECSHYPRHPIPHSVPFKAVHLLYPYATCGAGKASSRRRRQQISGFSLRNPAYPDMPITLEMLASHTSSLRDGDNYMAPPDVSIKEFFVPQGRMWEGGAHFAPKEEPPGHFFPLLQSELRIVGDDYRESYRRTV